MISVEKPAVKMNFTIKTCYKMNLFKKPASKLDLLRI